MRKISVKTIQKEVSMYVGASDLRDVIPTMRDDTFEEVFTIIEQRNLAKAITKALSKYDLNSRQRGDWKHFRVLFSGRGGYEAFEEGVEDLTFRLNRLEGLMDSPNTENSEDRTFWEQEASLIKEVLNYMLQRELVD